MAKFRLLLCSLLVFFMVLSSVSGQGSAKVPAMFIFGDSLIDNGNNNNLPSFAKANYFPYGIDFDGGPTGRFSNGYTMVDEIGSPSLSLSLSLSMCVCISTHNTKINNHYNI